MSNRQVCPPTLSAQLSKTMSTDFTAKPPAPPCTSEKNLCMWCSLLKECTCWCAQQYVKTFPEGEKSPNCAHEDGHWGERSGCATGPYVEWGDFPYRHSSHRVPWKALQGPVQDQFIGRSYDLWSYLDHFTGWNMFSETYRLGYFWFGCSTMLSSCPANSDKFKSYPSRIWQAACQPKSKTIQPTWSQRRWFTLYIAAEHIKV